MAGKLETMLLDGSILERLQADFPDMHLQAADEYMAYLDKRWETCPSNIFARYKAFKLEIMAAESLSLANRFPRHLPLNSRLGFRLVNIKTGHIRKVEKYGDVKRILSR